MIRFLAFIFGAAATLFLLMSMTSVNEYLPIVFVHGDSDTSGLWIGPIWRFESNGYPEDRLFAVNIAHPSARGDDRVAEENRSSTADAAEAVAREVDAALKATAAEKVILIANSRGCQTSRNYVKNFGGEKKVARMILTGCVHNGVFVAHDYAEGSEYNGAGMFLTALNMPPLLPTGIPITIIRSDKFDLYSQPDGRYIGNPGNPTGANYDSPELPGADNRVVAGVDHRETAFSPASFAIMYEVITGEKPKTTEIVAVEHPVLSGLITGYDNAAPTNMPLSGAHLAIYETDRATGARLGRPVYEVTVGEDGKWGDFAAKPAQTYVFEIRAKGYPVTRIFRSPFPRSFHYLNLRLYPAPLPGAFVHIMRPRGYFGPDDLATANGKPLPGIERDDPVPHVWQSSVAVNGQKPESVMANFNGETIAAWFDPAEKNAVTWIELTY
jgi:pimeloyl-ACP methyl ester carboxylesterase